MTQPMTAHDWGVFFSVLIPLFVGCLAIVVGGMKLLDLLDRDRRT
jgi:hypothetical protein